MEEFNETEYVRDLKESDWAPFFNNVDPSYCWDYFTGIITQTLDKKYPLKNHKKKVLNTSWLDNEALDIIGQRNRLFKKARRSGRDIDWALAKENQSRAKKRLREIRVNYIKDNLYNLKDKPSLFWKTTSEVFKNNSQSSVPSELLALSENDRALLCDKFNTFFSEVGLKLINSTIPLTAHEETKLNDRINDYTLLDNDGHVMRPLDSFELHEVNESKIEKIIKELSNKKSSGVSNVPMFVLKVACLALLPQLTHIVNLSFCFIL